MLQDLIKIYNNNISKKSSNNYINSLFNEGIITYKEADVLYKWENLKQDIISYFREFTLIQNKSVNYVKVIDKHGNINKFDTLERSYNYITWYYYG